MASALSRNQKNRKISRKGAKAAKEKEFFEPFGVCWCVMLNEVKHLLCGFPDSFDGELKSRFFVARLLRMTHESKTRC